MPSNEDYPHIGDDNTPIDILVITPQELAKAKQNGYWLKCEDGTERILINEDGMTVLSPYKVEAKA